MVLCRGTQIVDLVRRGLRFHSWEFRPFLKCCRLSLPAAAASHLRQPDNNKWRPCARACTRCSLTSAGGRRSFVFGLIGCIIWDTSSGVKPSEEAWEAGAFEWGMGVGDVHSSWLKHMRVHPKITIFFFFAPILCSSICSDESFPFPRIFSLFFFFFLVCRGPP